MLEKMAEMVREDGLPPVHYCEYCKRYNPVVCECRHTRGECEPAADKKNVAFARCAVLLVARALPSWEEYEKAGVEHERRVMEWQEARDKGMPMSDFIRAKDDAFAKWTELDGMVMTELMNLIAEAKEAAHE